MLGYTDVAQQVRMSHTRHRVAQSNCNGKSCTVVCRERRILLRHEMQAQKRNKQHHLSSSSPLSFLKLLRRIRPRERDTTLPSFPLPDNFPSIPWWETAEGENGHEKQQHIDVCFPPPPRAVFFPFDWGMLAEAARQGCTTRRISLRATVRLWLYLESTAAAVQWAVHGAAAHLVHFTSRLPVSCLSLYWLEQHLYVPWCVCYCLPALPCGLFRGIELVAVGKWKQEDAGLVWPCSDPFAQLLHVCLFMA